MDLITVNDVSKTYGEKESQVHALNRITLQIKKNDFVALLGPSGSGKSTLLNVISGLERADAGEIYFAKENITRYKDKQLVQFRRQYTGYIFQQYHLIPNLTVQENIEIGKYLNADSLDLDEITKELNIQHLKKRFPYELSGGQQQRVAIARALIKKPEILFCDEATGALDEENGKQVLSYLQHLQRKYGLTIVFVTHHVGIAKMARHIIKLNSGRLVDQIMNDQPLTAEEISWG
ncbi:ABC transporter ATP-binding protein [Paenibacillus profundus]|uniref:ABC transporter ATP-binding protein n=1 Tax=Paenibacillus profundus TaxID=1173085 RepID=A0ABS8YEX1_9BACL|nr:ABC transporter ATP-binding protein [Paenibacillus profundus]MCE5169784.1 ABC transporter ATP-binding protein [Paenibacillus profundus]